MTDEIFNLSAIGSPEVPDNTLIFKTGDDVVLTLTPEGFIYMGHVIEDAGDARRIFMQVMEAMQFNLRLEAVTEEVELRDLLIKFFLASDCATADPTVCNRIHKLLKTGGT